MPPDGGICSKYLKIVWIAVVYAGKTIVSYAQCFGVGRFFLFCVCKKNMETQSKRVAVIIPAYNEEGNIGLVVGAVPREELNVVAIIVADNGSTDQSAEQAQAAGAIVVREDKRGYGAACLRAMAYIAEMGLEVDIVVFLDGDYSDYPEQMGRLVQPIAAGEADLVLGSRVLGNCEKGALTPQQRFGNWLATRLLRWFYGLRNTDLGPFRAIRYAALLALEMEDQNYGWTIEMQIKAARQKLRVKEVPVDYRRRFAGQSKVSGTLKGSFLAGYKIIKTLFKY